MNTSLTNHEAQLLVDIETGRVLRADDNPRVSYRYLDSHPFIWGVDFFGRRSFFAGPDADRASSAHKRGEPTSNLDVVRYDVLDDVGGYVTLQRVAEEA